MIRIQLDRLEKTTRMDKTLRQGFVLSPILFHIKEVIKEVNGEIRVGVNCTTI